MKIVKCLLIVFFLFVVFFFGVVIVIFYFFKDELVMMVCEEVNKIVNVEVDFLDVSFFLLCSFFDFSLWIDLFFVIGKDVFEGVLLVKGVYVVFIFDFMFVIWFSELVVLKFIYFE